jgi:sortase A
MSEINPPAKRKRRAGRLEIIAWSAGCLLLATYGAGRWYAEQSHDEGIKSFREAQQTVRLQTAGQPTREPTPLRVLLPTQSDSRHRQLNFSPPDQSSWSATRLAHYATASSASDISAPEAILSIAKQNIQIPIYPGTSEWNLNRGAGRIEGTAPFGKSGNTGLAAHRDGYFRSLQNIVVGDRMAIETLDARYEYAVTQISIVSPRAVEVLAPSSHGVLTLVTCYPFYFAGPAPQRFIVRAERVDATSDGLAHAAEDK